MKTCFLIYLLGMAALAGIEPSPAPAARSNAHAATAQGPTPSAIGHAPPAGLDCKAPGGCPAVSRD